MGKEILMLGDIEIEKKQILAPEKSYIFKKCRY